ncbi:hypothetical protein [Paraburkholderia caffeinilytica]|nr:hypothetical protein [Paraburkholderia caffeinilytica]
MQVLELARFYHATPNAAEHTRRSGQVSRAAANAYQKRKSPRNLAISWG